MLIKTCIKKHSVQDNDKSFEDLKLDIGIKTCASDILKK